MATKVQSVLIPLEISFDNGLTWKTLVCLTNYNAPLATPLNETDTFCGKDIGMGNPALDFAGEAVADLAPSAGQVSLKDLDTAQLAKTVILARAAYPGTGSGSVGSLLKRQTAGVVESTNVKFQTNDLVKFDFSIKGQGIPVIS